MRYEFLVVAVKVFKIGVHLRKLSQTKSGSPFFGTPCSLRRYARHCMASVWVMSLWRHC